MRFGLFPSLFACAVSVLAYNFFFLPPIYTFTIADPENVVALFFFLIVAVIASNVAARGAQPCSSARSRARTNEELFGFSRKLARRSARSTICCGRRSTRSRTMLKVRVVILMPSAQGIEVKAGYPPEDQLDEADLAAARWTWEQAAPPAAAPTRCLARSACSCRCAPAAGRSACSASTATSPARC